MIGQHLGQLVIGFRKKRFSLLPGVPRNGGQRNGRQHVAELRSHAHRRLQPFRIVDGQSMFVYESLVGEKSFVGDVGVIGYVKRRRVRTIVRIHEV